MSVFIFFLFFFFVCLSRLLMFCISFYVIHSTNNVVVGVVAARYLLKIIFVDFILHSVCDSISKKKFRFKGEKILEDKVCFIFYYSAVLHLTMSETAHLEHCYIFFLFYLFKTTLTLPLIYPSVVLRKSNFVCTFLKWISYTISCESKKHILFSSCSFYFSFFLIFFYFEIKTKSGQTIDSIILQWNLHQECS